MCQISDGALSSSSEETNFVPTYVNCQFANVARDWFDHMVSEVKNNTEQQFSLKKHMFHLDSDHSARKVPSCFIAAFNRFVIYILIYTGFA